MKCSDNLITHLGCRVSFIIPKKKASIIVDNWCWGCLHCQLVDLWPWHFHRELSLNSIQSISVWVLQPRNQRMRHRVTTDTPPTHWPITRTWLHYSSEVIASAMKYSSLCNEGCIDLNSSTVGSEEAEGMKSIPQIILLCFISSAHLHRSLIRLSCMEVEAAAPTHCRLDMSSYR